MIRILHTSDWHLGHKLGGKLRLEEQRRIIDQILAVIEETEPHAVLIAGDIFDQPQPAHAVERLWHRFLIDALARRPGLQIVAIAGNHDAPSHLGRTSPLTDALQIRVLGRAPSEGAPAADFLVPLTAGQSQPAAWLAAIPYLSPHELMLGADATPAEVDAAYRQRLDPIWQALQAAAGGLPTLAMMHHTFLGAQPSPDSERPVMIGQVDGLSTSIFPDWLSYVALGHFHRAQPVGGSTRIWYSGSPLLMSETETVSHQQLRLIDVADDGALSQSGYQLQAPARFIRLPEQGYKPWAELVPLLTSLPDGEADALSPYLVLGVERLLATPEWEAEREAILSTKAVRLLRVDHAQEAAAQGPDQVQSLEEFQRIRPRDVFAKLVEERGADLDESQRAAVIHCFERVEDLARDR